MDEDGRTAAGLFRSEEAKRILFAMGGATATSRFVGRTAELGRLEAAYTYARGGDPVTLCPDLWAAAAKAWQRLGEPYPTAYARWREAEALLLGGLACEQVEPSLRAAHATASELGAAPLRAEIEALARRGRLNLGTDAATPTPAPAPPSPLDRLGLTAREQEVLALVAIGRTNRQIAQTLFISPKTATVHVSNILGKLGVRSRVEAATIAHRLGIVKPGS
jgi:DNA-binding CsgD family transcriptional regulator